MAPKISNYLFLFLKKLKNNGFDRNSHYADVPAAKNLLRVDLLITLKARLSSLRTHSCHNILSRCFPQTNVSVQALQTCQRLS